MLQMEVDPQQLGDWFSQLCPVSSAVDVSVQTNSQLVYMSYKKSLSIKRSPNVTLHVTHLLVN